MKTGGVRIVSLSKAVGNITDFSVVGGVLGRMDIPVRLNNKVEDLSCTHRLLSLSVRELVVKAVNVRGPRAVARLSGRCNSREVVVSLSDGSGGMIVGK